MPEARRLVSAISHSSAAWAASWLTSLMSNDIIDQNQLQQKRNAESIAPVYTSFLPNQLLYCP